MTRIVFTILWTAVCAPALLQLSRLARAIAGRFFYPFDLEWMEGGMLHHADRLASGASIYPEPSIQFIPYLYTPLYPAIVGGFGKVFGISYQLGRLLSVAATVGIFVIIGFQSIYCCYRSYYEQPNTDTVPPNRIISLLPHLWAVPAVVLGAGVFAACYPWMEGWYDIVRGDTLFVALALGGITMLWFWARPNAEHTSQRFIITTIVLSLSFFCKQTGIFYVAVGGIIVLLRRPRRVLPYVVIAGCIGGIGTLLINIISDGWCWTYIFQVHQSHDFSTDRFFRSFGNMFGFLPAVTLVAALGILPIFVQIIRRQPLLLLEKTYLLWVFVWLVSITLGALGWATQWAHFNAYLPAMTCMAICTSLSIVVVVYVLTAYCHRSYRILPTIAGAVLSIAVAVSLALSSWSPETYIPTTADTQAGNRLIDMIDAIPGEVWIPYHPWYAHLADKTPYAHRMGLMDMQAHKPSSIQDMPTYFAEKQLSAVILNKHPGREFGSFAKHYKLAAKLPPSHQPNTVTGASTKPKTLWLPISTRQLRPYEKVIFDFDSSRLFSQSHFESSEGAAWGIRPTAVFPNLQTVTTGTWGRYFLSSIHGGVAAKGTLTTPAFPLEKPYIELWMAGVADSDNTSVRLIVNQKVVATLPLQFSSQKMIHTSWQVDAFVGKTAKLQFVDNSEKGYLIVDQIVQTPKVTKTTMATEDRAVKDSVKKTNPAPAPKQIRDSDKSQNDNTH